MALCICIADHNLTGDRVRCLASVPGNGRKCANCKAPRAETPRPSNYRDVRGFAAIVR